MIIGVSQGLVLALVMLVIYIIDMTEGLNCNVNLFVDIAKLLKKVGS